MSTGKARPNAAGSDENPQLVPALAVLGGGGTIEAASYSVATGAEGR